LLVNATLESAHNLVVVKSISKSYGVPGLRLGVIASADTELVGRIRKACAIWNINSFGEYYMQIFGKYESNYHEACARFRKVRSEFYRELCKISFLRVVPSQANYFLCEITERFTSRRLAELLLERANILIKDCSGKRAFPEGSQYVRIAIRDTEDNRHLIEALQML
jgi:histidinol-phosphate/aromatic aminotransferase/cobyric acid decarboxylase-like protein